VEQDLGGNHHTKVLVFISYLNQGSNPMSAGTQTVSPKLLSSADPILSTVTPNHFPQQFSRLSEQTTNSLMSQLLEDVRSGRSESETRSQFERIHMEELRHSREVARLQAQKKGLPPPGADVKMFRRIYPHDRRRWTKSTITDGELLNKNERRVGNTVLEVAPLHPTHELQAISPIQNVGGVTPLVVNGGRGIFETISDVLLADALASNVTPVPATVGIEEDSEKYTRGRFKFGNRRPR
jgi:hypothetical protein